MEWLLVRLLIGSGFLENSQSVMTGREELIADEEEREKEQEAKHNKQINKQASKEKHPTTLLPHP
jgi:hypothetical protein